MNNLFIINKQKGFSLIEVIIVIFILGIAIVPILSYFANSVENVHEIEMRSQANSIISDIIELMKSTTSENWGNLTAWETNSTSLVGYSPTLEDSAGNSYNIPDFLTDYDLLSDNYDIEVVLEHFEDFPPDEETDDNEIGRKVTITLSWGDGEESITTLIRNR